MERPPPAPRREGKQAVSQGRKRTLNLKTPSPEPEEAPAPVLTRPRPSVLARMQIRAVRLPSTPVYAPEPLSDLLGGLSLADIESDQTEY
jgi:hypothetical protein